MGWWVGGEWKSGLIGNRSSAAPSLCSYSLLLLSIHDGHIHYDDDDEVDDDIDDDDDGHRLYALILSYYSQYMMGRHTDYEMMMKLMMI